MGTFKVSRGICTIGMVNHKKVNLLYKTETENVKFLKKHTGASKVHPRFGNTVNITQHYEYIAKVFRLNPDLIKETIPSKIVKKERNSNSGYI